MKMITEYLEHALEFEQLASEETGELTAGLLKQAQAYRDLAAARARKLNVLMPSGPPPTDQRDANDDLKLPGTAIT